MKTKKKRKTKEGKKEVPLKISGNFNEVLKVAVKGNPKPVNKKQD